MRETYGSNTLDFLYDANGMPYALKYNGTFYYYITNLQGDVMQVVNASGNVVAAYEYDPYGNIISATGSLAETNPMRYRGYYFDSESGLYYLQSRYYDPEIGRFLNADAFAFTGALLGSNMYSYCWNCPVNFVDSGGCFPCAYQDKDSMLDVTTGIVDAGGGGGGLPGSSGASAKKQFYILIDREIGFYTNTDEQLVLDAKDIAFYKGTLVIKTNKLSGCAFTFGIIVMADDIKDDIQLVRHEYGHVVQTTQTGVIPYIVLVMIPSVTCFWLTECKVLPGELYYSYPWERSADYFGGASHDYIAGSEYIASAYWLNTLADLTCN